MNWDRSGLVALSKEHVSHAPDRLDVCGAIWIVAQLAPERSCHDGPVELGRVIADPLELPGVCFEAVPSA